MGEIMEEEKIKGKGKKEKQVTKKRKNQVYQVQLSPNPYQI